MSQVTMIVVGPDWPSLRDCPFQRFIFSSDNAPGSPGSHSALSAAWPQCVLGRPDMKAHSFLQRPWLWFKGKGGWADSRLGTGATGICWNGATSPAGQQGVPAASNVLPALPCRCICGWPYLSILLRRREGHSVFAFFRDGSSLLLYNSSLSSKPKYPVSGWRQVCYDWNSPGDPLTIPQKDNYWSIYKVCKIFHFCTWRT